MGIVVIHDRLIVIPMSQSAQWNVIIRVLNVAQLMSNIFFSNKKSNFAVSGCRERFARTARLACRVSTLDEEEGRNHQTSVPSTALLTAKATTPQPLCRGEGNHLFCVRWKQWKQVIYGYFIMLPQHPQVSEDGLAYIVGRFVCFVLLHSAH